MYRKYSDDSKSLIIPILITILLLSYLLFSEVSERQYIGKQETLQHTTSKQQEVRVDREESRNLEASAVSPIIIRVLPQNTEK